MRILASARPGKYTFIVFKNKEGLEQGINQGEEKLNSLYVFLMNDGKLEEMKRVMHDKAYRQELYKVYGL